MNLTDFLKLEQSDSEFMSWIESYWKSIDDTSPVVSSMLDSDTDREKVLRRDFSIPLDTLLALLLGNSSPLLSETERVFDKPGFLSFFRDDRSEGS